MTVAAALPGSIAHPFTPDGRRDPYPAYTWLRTHDPVHHDPMTGMWLVTGHGDCAALLRDPVFSAAAGQRERAREDDLPLSMLTSDGIDHARLRAPGALLLGPGALAEVEAGITADVDALLAQFDRPDARVVDAVEEVGVPLATAVLARLFGLGPDLRVTLARFARAVSVNLDPLAPPPAARLGRAAMGELTRFLDAHIAQASPSPLSRLAADGRLSRAEVLGVLGLAVVGGWQPLAESIGNALTWLLPRPEARARLAAADEVAGLLAMDELLRLEAPIPFTARVTVTEARLPGGRIPEGARVLAVLAAANRDPEVFSDPDRLVLDRSPNPHLAFGGGAHFCLAARLVRQAGAVLLTRLVRRYPQAALSGPAPVWAPSLIPRRITGLGMTFGRRGGAESPGGAGALSAPAAGTAAP